MAFYIQQVDGGRNPGHEYLPAGAIVPKVGMALTMNSGKLAIASGTTPPSYISMTQRDTALTDGEVIPVMRVLPDMMFETTFQASASSIKPGAKVTIHTDGMQITATTAGGVAEVISMDGTTAGSKASVRFPGVVAAASAGG